MDILPLSRSRILPLLAVLSLFVACSGTPSDTTESEDKHSSRLSAPAFEGVSLNGKDFALADYKGKVVLINFWATWCGPCRMEIPELAKLQTSYENQDLIVLGISLDEESPSYVLQEAERMGVNYPVVIAEAGVSRAWGGISAIPTTFLIDRKGRIAHRLMGYTDVERLVELLRPLFEEKA